MLQSSISATGANYNGCRVAVTTDGVAVIIGSVFLALYGPEASDSLS